MKKLLKGVLAGALFIYAASMAPANATVIFNDNPGGVLQKFEAQFSHLRKTGEPVVVSGYCNSACTLMTGMLPNKQVCVTPGTVFGFHSAFKWGPNGSEIYAPDGTRDMWHRLSPQVRGMLAARGWHGNTPHPDLIEIQGTEIYKPCA